MSPTAIPGNLILKNEMVEADPFFNNVSLLLHGDGANGSTTIVDSSPSPKTVTAFGDAQISTAQSKFGGASIAFDGDGDYLTVAQSNDFIVGADPFTIEMWAYLNTQGETTGIQALFGSGPAQNNAYFVDYNNATGKLEFSVFGGGSSATSAAVSLDQWLHIAVVRSSTGTGGVKVYIDGTLGITHQYAGVGWNTFSIGNLVYRTGDDLNGYLDEFRFTKGIARYTSNFTPPTAPFPEVLG